MKKFFAEVKVGIFLDEMDDNNSEDSISELVERLVHECISETWNSDIVTTCSQVRELSEFAIPHFTLASYTDTLDRA